MSRIQLKNLFIFVLGMLTFGVGSFVTKTFLFYERPDKNGIVENWEEICLWQDNDGITLSISPKGCYSSSCTQIKQQVGTATIDLQEQEIHLSARSVLREVSRFPLPCIDNCLGGGSILINLANLIPNDYTIWFMDQKVGEVMVFSGKPTPRQCFENPIE